MEPIISNQRNIFKKISDKNKKFIEKNLDKLKPLKDNDYIINDCFNINNHIEFYSNKNRIGLDILLPIEKLKTKCKDLKLFQEQYKKANILNSKIIEYNKIIL